jgi:hypothetical protein
VDVEKRIAADKKRLTETERLISYHLYVAGVLRNRIENLDYEE